MSEAGRPDGDLQTDLLEAAPDAMIGGDDDGLIRFANRQVEVLFGYPRAELIGRPVEVLVPELDDRLAVELLTPDDDGR